MAEGSAVSKNVRALASVVTVAAADHMDVPHLKSLADAIQSALKVNLRFALGDLYGVLIFTFFNFRMSRSLLRTLQL